MFGDQVLLVEQVSDQASQNTSASNAAAARGANGRVHANRMPKCMISFSEPRLPSTAKGPWVVASGKVLERYDCPLGFTIHRASAIKRVLAYSVAYSVAYSACFTKTTLLVFFPHLFSQR